MQIDILGTKYTVKEDKSLIHTQTDGICKTYDKVILYRPMEAMLNSEDGWIAKERRYREVIRHEVVHAFFEEAGLAEYCSDERLVDWIAKQFPKMLGAMRGAGGLNIL